MGNWRAPPSPETKKAQLKLFGEAAPPAGPPTSPPGGNGGGGREPSRQRRHRLRLPPRLRITLIYALMGTTGVGGVGAAVGAYFAEQTRGAVTDLALTVLTGVYQRLYYGQVIESEPSSITPPLLSEINTGSVDAPAETKKQTTRRKAANPAENRLIRLLDDFGRAIDRFFGYPGSEP